MSFSALSLSLVINCGSSSLKFAVIPVAHANAPILTGLAECLGLDNASITFKDASGVKKEIALDKGARHDTALKALIAELRTRGLLDNIAAIGHRVVHGGNRFKSSVLITPEVIADIEACSPLAPLHNPANLLGINAAVASFPKVPQVAVFDTAFHQTMKPEAYTYAIPYRYLQENDVRRYGFHGTSHLYVSQEAVSVLGLDPGDHGLVTAHLGNGASVTAVQNGKSMDTSMGLTPLEGLVMGTRSGDIDFGAMSYIAGVSGKSMAELDRMLNKESGLLGISGLSSDCRALEEARREGHAGATLAIDVFVHRLARHIGAHATSLRRFDALVFTGGIGENSPLIRELTVKRLEVFGIKLDAEKNVRMVRGKAGVISQEGDCPVVLVQPTNEEGVIARDAARIAGLGV